MTTTTNTSKTKTKNGAENGTKVRRRCWLKQHAFQHGGNGQQERDRAGAFSAGGSRTRRPEVRRWLTTRNAKYAEAFVLQVRIEDENR
jgi:hypothetical protein